MEKNNITLIGMPGSGKTTLGKLLAKKLNFNFIDYDKHIAKQEKMSAQQIVDTKGDGAFLKIEEERILETLPLKKHIISPGGSVVYSERLMNILKNSSLIIFLDLPLGIIEKRLTDRARRGIVGLKSKSIKELYEERAPLYKKYADITINCFKKFNNEIIEEITQKLNDQIS